MGRRGWGGDMNGIFWWECFCLFFFLRGGWGLGKYEEGRRLGFFEGGCKYMCFGVDFWGCNECLRWFISWGGLSIRIFVVGNGN